MHVVGTGKSKDKKTHKAKERQGGKTEQMGIIRTLNNSAQQSKQYITTYNFVWNDDDEAKRNKSEGERLSRDKPRNGTTRGKRAEHIIRLLLLDCPPKLAVLLSAGLAIDRRDVCIIKTSSPPASRSLTSLNTASPSIFSSSSFPEVLYKKAS